MDGCKIILSPPIPDVPIVPSLCFYNTCSSESPERICHCDDQCGLYRDCCADATSTTLPNNRTQSQHLSNLLACQISNFQGFVHFNEKAHLMVSSCPLEWGNNQRAEQISMNCTNASLFLPVNDPNTKFTFRNIYCALCNNISQEQVIPWMPDYVCDLNTTLKLKAHPNNILATIMEQCTLLKYIPTNGRSCFPMVSSCPPGNRSDPEYNRLVRNCMTGDQNVVIGGQYFKNTFCAECNGVSNSGCAPPIPPLPPPG